MTRWGDVRIVRILVTHSRMLDDAIKADGIFRRCVIELVIAS